MILSCLYWIVLHVLLSDQLFRSKKLWFLFNTNSWGYLTVLRCSSIYFPRHQISNKSLHLFIFILSLISWRPYSSINAFLILLDNVFYINNSNCIFIIVLGFVPNYHWRTASKYILVPNFLNSDIVTWLPKIKFKPLSVSRTIDVDRNVK